MIKIGERIKMLTTLEGITPTELERQIGASKGVLSRAVTKGSNVQAKWLTAIAEKYPDWSLEWLLTGKGKSLKSEHDNDQIYQAAYSRAKEDLGTESTLSNASEVGGVYSASARDDAAAVVPFIPVSAHASFLETFESSAEADFECMPIIPLKEERQNIGQYKIFEVEGDSMFPTISDGSLILVKEIPESRWHYAEGVVVAVYAEYVVVKRILRNNLLTGDTLVLGSDNEKYGQMTVQLSDLRALFKAKRIISSYIY